MNIQRVLDLIDVVAEADIAELTVDDGNVEIHLARRTALLDVSPLPGTVSLPAEAPAGALTSSPVMAGKPTGAATAESKVVHKVLAPMVGTFHRSAKAGGEPLIQVGARVEKGVPLCVIEAMKIMNEIEADRAGIVTQVLCEEGQAIEVDQPLFSIE